MADIVNELRQCALATEDHEAGIQLRRAAGEIQRLRRQIDGLIGASSAGAANPTGDDAPVGPHDELLERARQRGRALAVTDEGKARKPPSGWEVWRGTLTELDDWLANPANRTSAAVAVYVLDEGSSEQVGGVTQVERPLPGAHECRHGYGSDCPYCTESGEA